MVSPSVQSAPSSLYNYGMPRNFSTPSLHGVKSLSPVPMTDPRPHTVTSNRNLTTPTAALEDAPSTSPLPWRIRKSRSASILSLRKFSQKKQTSAADPVLPPASAQGSDAYASPSSSFTFAWDTHGSPQMLNTSMSLDLQHGPGNDTSTMVSPPEQGSKELPDTPKSLAQSLYPPPSTTSRSSNDVPSASPAMTDREQESLKILAEVEGPWFQPPMPLPMPYAPVSALSRTESLSDSYTKPVQIESMMSTVLKESESLDEATSLATPIRGAKARSPSHSRSTDGQASVATAQIVPPRPSMAFTEYSPVSRYSGLSVASPPKTDRPSFSPTISLISSPPWPYATWTNDSPIHATRAPTLTNRDSSFGSDTRKGVRAISTSPVPQGLGFQPYPTTQDHNSLPSRSGPHYTYSIVHDVQPQIQRHVSPQPPSGPVNSVPLYPGEVSQGTLTSSSDRKVPMEHASQGTLSTKPPPFLPAQVLSAKVSPSPPFSEAKGPQGLAHESDTDNPLHSSLTERSLSSTKNLDGKLRTSLHLEDKEEDMLGKPIPSSHGPGESVVLPSSVAHSSPETRANVDLLQARKNEAEESISLRIKEFQSQQDALRGTIESSRAEILQLREKIRAFRAELDEGTGMYPSTDRTIYGTVDLQPCRRESLRDSLASMDDLDRRLTQMLESHR